MSKLWKRTSEKGQDLTVGSLELQELDLSSPTVIYLSGFLTTDKNNHHVTGSIRSMEAFLQGIPDIKEQPKVYAWSYTSVRSCFNVAVYNLRPQKAYGIDAENFARQIIVPATSRDGRPLPFEEAQKKLRNLTLFGYSSGTILAQGIFNGCLKFMQELGGYSEQDARKLLHEVALVSVGNTSRPTQEQNRFTTIYLAGSNDLLVRFKNRICVPFKKVFSRYARKLTIKELSKTSLFITARLSGKLWEMRKNKKTGIVEKKRFSGLWPSWLPGRSRHELPHYMTTDDSHSHFSKIVLNAMANAVNRRDTIDVWQLLEPIPSLTPADTAAYRARIEAAKPEALNV